MRLKRFIVSTIAVFVVMFALSYLWHVVLMSDFYNSDAKELPMREEPLVGYVVLAYMVISIVMAYLYPRVSFKLGGRLSKGLRFGMVIAVAWVIPMQLIDFAVMEHVHLSAICVDAAWHLVEQGIGGIALAIVFAED